MTMRNIWNMSRVPALLTVLGVTLGGANLGADDETVVPNARYGGKFDSSPVRIPAAYRERTPEMRGIWVATVNNIDFPRCETWEEFQRRIKAMMAQLGREKFNAVFFQVRSNNDAFYPSRLNPWSRFLTGTEGRKPEGDFDPLRYMIDEAHRNGLEFHAWLNPYRVIGSTPMSKNAYLKSLAPQNFARRNPALVMETLVNAKERRLVLNPGEPQVREFVTATVMELVRNYPLDGIHFDDYFYPDRAPDDADRDAFRKYNSQQFTQEDWRRNNVNLLIYTLSRELNEYNRRNRRNVRFGVSPFGIWRNRQSTPEGSLTGGSESYSSHYADTRLWVREGWIDYIVPQIYWNFNHDVAAYAALCDWWCETVRGTRTDLYIGMGAYRLGEAGWGAQELYRQLLYNQKHPEIKGEIIFSWRNLENPGNAAMKNGGIEMLRRIWKHRAPTP